MQLKNRNILFLGVPFRSGANRDGTQYAPTYLIDAISLLGYDCQMMTFDECNLSSQSKGVNNYEDVLMMRNKVMNESRIALERYNKIVVFGGDHSVSIGSIAGVLAKYPNVGVIWFDAHTDINTEFTSPTGNAHGMPLAALLGLCHSDINLSATRLKIQNVFWIGSRDVDKGEWEIIQKLGIENQVFTSEMVRDMGMEQIMHQVKSMLIDRRIEDLHVSFDVDAMDPSLVEATGVKAPRGLTTLDYEQFIDGLAQPRMPNIVSVDFVEYNPLLDDSNNTTGRWLLENIKKFLNICF